MESNFSLPHQPAEWEEHEACWLAWPSHGDLWQEDLETTRQEFTALCRAISGERLEILVPDAENKSLAEKALRGLNARFHLIPFGDIWLRDTGPIFLWGKNGEVEAARFTFNGWGGKYVLPFDTEVSTAISKITGFPSHTFPWVLEGGSLDVDGKGTCLTTRQCLLNPNRNPKLNQGQIEGGLRQALGVTKVLWLHDGLLNDHTDGHIDTIARFIKPGVVLCMHPSGSDDPNAHVLQAIEKDLKSMSDAHGRKLEVLTLPSPGKVVDEENEILAASYVNFYISNESVVVPQYGQPNDSVAVQAIAELFPGRKTVGVSAKSILTGGGAFHCITQQQPKALK